MLKYGPNGDTLWIYRYDGPTVGVTYISKILLDSAQNLTVFGTCADTVALNLGLFAVHLSPDGEELWRSTYFEPGIGLSGLDARWLGDRWVFWGQYATDDGYFRFAWQVGEGGVNFGGSFTELDMDQFNDAWHIDAKGNLYIGADLKFKVTKYDMAGQKLWVYEKPYSLTPPTPGVLGRTFCIESGKDSEVYVSGFVNLDSLGRTPHTSKINANGQMIWEHFIELNGIKNGVPQCAYWLDNERLVVMGSITTNLNSASKEIFLSTYTRWDAHWKDCRPVYWCWYSNKPAAYSESAM